MLIPPVVTTTVNEPAVAGFVENVIVIEVALAAVTSPTVPLFRVTVFFATVGSKPNPLITSVDPLAVKFVVPNCSAVWWPRLLQSDAAQESRETIGSPSLS